MPKNIWEVKITHGFLSVGKPAMLLLASVRTGVSPACTRSKLWASTGTGRGAQWQHRVRMALGTTLSSTHRHRLTFLLVTLKAYKSIWKSTKRTGLCIKIKSEARHFKLWVKQRTVPFSAPQIFHNFRSNIFNLFLLCRHQLESTLLYYQTYCN